MIGTLFVVVCALAIAIIGCAIVDPRNGLSESSNSERRSLTHHDE